MTEEIREQGAELAQFNEIEAGLVSLRDKFSSKVYDVTTVKGMAEAKSDRSQLRAGRTAVEKIRKALKAPHLEAGRLIEAKASEIKAVFQELEAPVAAVIKEEEDRKAQIKAEKEAAEKKRIAGIFDRIADFAFILSQYHPVSDLEANMERLKKAEIDGSFGEFVEKAQSELLAAKKACESAIVTAKQREAQEADGLAKREEDARIAEEKRIEDEKKRKEEAAAAKKKAEEAAENERKMQAEIDEARREKEEAERKERLQSFRYDSIRPAIDHIGRILSVTNTTDAQKIAAIQEIVDANQQGEDQ